MRSQPLVGQGPTVARTSSLQSAVQLSELLLRGPLYRRARIKLIQAYLLLVLMTPLVRGPLLVRLARPSYDVVAVAKVGASPALLHRLADSDGALRPAELIRFKSWLVH